MELERRHSNGRGLLFDNGASRANILSGDAPHSLLTMSTVLAGNRPGRIGQDYFAYFASPYNVLRTLALRGPRGYQRAWSAAQQKRLDVQPARASRIRVLAGPGMGHRDPARPPGRGDHRGPYAGRRLPTRPSSPTTRWPTTRASSGHDALRTLRRVDRQIGRIAAAAEYAPRPYRFVVLSDHGQSQGATFLRPLRRDARAAGHRACSAEPDESAAEGSARRGARVPRRIAHRGRGGRLAPAERPRRRVAAPQADERRRRRRRSELARDLGDGLRLPRPDLVPAPARPADARADRGALPGADPDALAHPGIGFMLVRSSVTARSRSAPHGEHRRSTTARVDGEDPLAPFGPNAAGTCGAPTASRTAPTSC